MGLGAAEHDTRRQPDRFGGGEHALVVNEGRRRDGEHPHGVVPAVPSGLDNPGEQIRESGHVSDMPAADQPIDIRAVVQDDTGPATHRHHRQRVSPIAAERQIGEKNRIRLIEAEPSHDGQMVPHDGTVAMHHEFRLAGAARRGEDEQRVVGSRGVGDSAGGTQHFHRNIGVRRSRSAA